MNPSHPQQLLYGELSKYYDLIHSDYPYATHAEALMDLVTTYSAPHSGILLEAACGTGNYLQAIEGYVTYGFDASPSMLEIARHKLPNARLWCDQLSRFECHASAALIVCLCSAIGYLRDTRELDSSIACFSQALQPNGILVIRPWERPATMVARMATVEYQSPLLRVRREGVSVQRGNVSEITYRWHILAAGKSEYVVEDHHKLRYFGDDEFRDLFLRHGLQGEKQWSEPFRSSLWIAWHG